MALASNGWASEPRSLSSRAEVPFHTPFSTHFTGNTSPNNMSESQRTGTSVIRESHIGIVCASNIRLVIIRSYVVNFLSQKMKGDIHESNHPVRSYVTLSGFRLSGGGGGGSSVFPGGSLFPSRPSGGSFGFSGTPSSRPGALGTSTAFSGPPVALGSAPASGEGGVQTFTTSVSAPAAGGASAGEDTFRPLDIDDRGPA